MRRISTILLPVGILFALAALLFSCLADGGGGEAPFRVNAKGAALIDGASGRVLFGQDENRMLPMASTTKIMTALLALENCGMDETVTASQSASGTPGTSIYLRVGEQLNMEQMLYGLMLRSGNDAAMAIAEHIAGDADAFAEMMNARAAEIGADAHFTNPHGLTQQGHAASALGLARIMREALTLEAFRAITGTRTKVIPWEGNEFSRALNNKNRLLSSYEGATGGKTGYTDAAGRCLVFSARRDGMELIGTVLNCPTWFDTATAMLDFGFENFRLVTALSAGEEAATAPVSGGASNAVGAVAADDLTAALALGEEATLSWVLYDVTAPVGRGQVIGYASLLANGEEAARVNLIAAQDVAEGGLFSALRRVLERWALSLRGSADSPA